MFLQRSSALWRANGFPRLAYGLRRHRPMSTDNYHQFVDIQPDVCAALQSGGPVVALESTIITHGMPFPQNLETARRVETVIRQQNAVPATIAIINGRIKVGLSDDELTMLARCADDEKPQQQLPTVKTSRRDLALVLSRRWNGGTTVAGTLIIADMVGIRVFATGGIGGVHRDGERTMDVSADLTELGRSAVAVVCSGAKSILDIPRTLEYLETQGVCVAALRTDSADFPAFYTRSSGVRAPYNFADADEAAAAIDVAHRLRLRSGMLIAVPVPADFAMDESKINAAIADALQRANAEGITGKEATPFLLAAIAEITAGRSLETNKALIENNARVAADIAVALSGLQGSHTSSPQRNCVNPVDGRKTLLEGRTPATNVPVVVGASVVDTCYSVIDGDLELNGATYQATLQTSGGGVGRNIAEALYKLHGAVHLISIVGDDQNGTYLKSLLPMPDAGQATVRTDPVLSTGSFAVVLDRTGDSKLVLGDMAIHAGITPELIVENEALIASAPIVVMDANLRMDTMAALLEVCKRHSVPVFFEPTDMRRAHLPFTLPRSITAPIQFASPNIHELHTIAKALQFAGDNCRTDTVDADALRRIGRIAAFVQQHIGTVVVTMGSLGVLVATANDDGDGADATAVRFYPAPNVPAIVNVSGAGDSFTSGFVAGMIGGRHESACVSIGFAAAAAALRSTGAVANYYFERSDENWQQSAKFQKVEIA